MKNKWRIDYEYDMCAECKSHLVVEAKTKTLAVQKAEKILKSKDYIFYRIDRCEQITEDE